MAKPRNEIKLTGDDRAIGGAPDPGPPPSLSDERQRPSAPRRGSGSDTDEAPGGGLPETEEILVVFVAHAACPWLRLLKPGFRHCFVALRQDGRWLVIDPLKRRLEVRLLPSAPAAGFDLAAFYLGQGHRVLRGGPPPHAVAVPRERRSGAAPPLRPLTCVEVVKRLVGLESAWTLTPRQLFRRLQRDPLAPFAELRSTGSGAAAPPAR